MNFFAFEKNNIYLRKYRFSLKGENYGIMVMHYIGDEKHAAEVSARVRILEFKCGIYLL